MENPLLTEYAAEIRYLLHRMEPDERDRFGQRVVQDEETFDRVREAETELYDAHVRNALPPDLRHDFHLHLLQSLRQSGRLKAAGVLARRSRPARMTPLALMALAAGLLLGLALVPRLLRNGAGTQPAELELRIDQTRAVAAIPEFRVSSQAPVELRIAVNPNEPAGQFRVRLDRLGATVWSREVTPVNHRISVLIPAGLLQPGIHELTVDSAGGAPVGFAEFKVIPALQ
jgi:hypothetical protein